MMNLGKLMGDSDAMKRFGTLFFFLMDVFLTFSAGK
jgi:hypothetical protein